MSGFPYHIHIEVHGNAYQYFNLPPEGKVAETAHLLRDDNLGEIVRIRPDVTFNKNRTTKSGRKAPDGIEIRFGNGKPIEPVREILKAHGFQFSEKQTMWYAIDNEKSRELAERWQNEEVEVDNTQYVKQNFWARIISLDEYNRLRGNTEFFLKADPPHNFYGKRQLESSKHSIERMIDNGLLFFKKHFNRAVDEEEDQAQGYDRHAVAEKLKALAEGMSKIIDEKINSAISKQRPTARRLRIASGMRDEGRELQEVQNTLFALSNAHLAEAIGNYPLLQQIRTKRQADLIYRCHRYLENNWDVEKGFENNKEELSKFGISSVELWKSAASQRLDLLNKHFDVTLKQTRQRDDQLKVLEDEVFRLNIPGFFPTPWELIDELLQLADIGESDSILDPSAGKGDILDAIVTKFPGITLDAIEINNKLREILFLKGYNVVGEDFLQVTPDGKSYDRIVMNPPFEGGQEVDHITHALKFLKPSGRLVAVIGEGIMFRQFKKETAFRELLMTMNAYVSGPIEEAFKNAFNSTSVRVRIVAINKSGNAINYQQPSNSLIIPEPQTLPSSASDEFTLLELEAEAELELLKLRLEIERKRQSLDGLDENRLRQLRRRVWAIQNKTDVLNFK